MKEDEALGEMEPLVNEPYTIKVKYHEGASRIGSDIHGVMCDLAASETVELKQGEVKIIPLGVSMKLPYDDFGIVVPRSSTCLKHGIMMANSIGIIENEYCGDGDVWGFVAYAIRDTVIEQGTRIAQFMPSPFVPDWNKIIFEEVESMGCADRGGYGSTGERSAGASIAKGRTYRDANGLELHVGDYVIDEFGECFCVMGLNREDGATAARSLGVTFCVQHTGRGSRTLLNRPGGDELPGLLCAQRTKGTQCPGKTTPSSSRSSSRSRRRTTATRQSRSTRRS